jgi:hypothetical protein
VIELRHDSQEKRRFPEQEIVVALRQAMSAVVTFITQLYQFGNSGADSIYGLIYLVFLASHCKNHCGQCCG